ncbi:MAG: hypothetical protein RL220_1578 [Bacteroidota bacterium]
MSKYELIISQRAVDGLKEIVEEVQKSSLVDAEKLRSKILHRLHFIQHHPHEQSRKVEIPKKEGEIRCSNIMNYRIYYLLMEEQILVMEIIAEKTGHNPVLR